jgi:hypothetical protein
LKGLRLPARIFPSDWSDEQRRTLHYQALGKPLDAQAFVRLLRTRMEAALTKLQHFNRVLPELNHLRVFRPRQNDDRDLWACAIRACGARVRAAALLTAHGSKAGNRIRCPNGARALQLYTNAHDILLSDSKFSALEFSADFFVAPPAEG